MHQCSIDDVRNRLGMIVNPANEAEDMQAIDEPKIFYCSRTHSQLTQFANEVRRVKISFALQGMTGSEESGSKSVEPVGEVKYLSLGSRRNLCIYPKVSRLKSLPMINERCLELQQPGTPQEDKCPFIPNKENETLVNDFRDHTLARVRDIEEMGELGNRIGVCPYYASRAGIRPSEVRTTIRSNHPRPILTLISHFADRAIACHTALSFAPPEDCKGSSEYYSKRSCGNY